MNEKRTPKYELLQRTGLNENVTIGQTLRKVGNTSIRPHKSSKNSGSRNRTPDSGCKGCSRSTRKY